MGRDTVLMVPKDGDRKGRVLRIASARAARRSGADDDRYIEVVAKKQNVDACARPAAHHRAHHLRARETARVRHPDPEADVEAVLAIEDRRFYAHAGGDPSPRKRVLNYVVGSKT